MSEFRAQTVDDADMKHGYKTVQFGPKERKIPEDWGLGKIGENTYLKGRIGWHGLTEDDHMEEGDYFLITGTDFENGRIQWDRCSYVDEEWYERDPNIQLEEEDILLTKDGSIGKTAYVDNLPKPATLNNGLFVMRPLNDSYLPKYMYYLLNSFYFDDFIETITAGSTISHLYQKDFVNFRFPLPSKKEQQYIAKILFTVDKQIQQTKKIVESVEELKRGLMQDLLHYGINHDKFQQVRIGPKLAKIPSSWQIEMLGNLTSVIHRYPNYYGIDYQSEGVPEVRVASLTGDGRIEPSSDGLRYITEETSREYPKTILESGDIVIVVRGQSLGKIGYVDDRFDGANLNPNLMRIALNEQVYSPYLKYVLLGWIGQEQLRVFSSGGNISALKKSDVSDLRIPLPSDSEQQAIADRIETVEQLEKQEEEKLERLEQIKRGLMQDLLTGKVRVDDLDIDNLNQGEPSTDE